MTLVSKEEQDLQAEKLALFLSPQTNRGKEFMDFVYEVVKHIETYTVPQYGDADWDNPENGDQMQSASIEDIQMNLKRYMNRMLSNARGKKETIRDLHKISHYAAIAWGKYKRGELILDDETIIKLGDNPIEHLKEILAYDDYKNIEITVKLTND